MDRRSDEGVIARLTSSDLPFEEWRVELEAAWRAGLVVTRDHYVLTRERLARDAARAVEIVTPPVTAVATVAVEAATAPVRRTRRVGGRLRQALRR